MVNDDEACAIDHVLGPLSPALIVNICCCIVFIIAYAKTWSNERDRPKARNAKKAKPEYGFGASGITLLLSLLGLLFAAPVIVLYLIWRHWNATIACSLAWTSLGFPIWPCIFAGLIIALVLGSWVRLRRRGKVVAALGIGGSDNVLVTPAYKGLFLTAVAKHLRSCHSKACPSLSGEASHGPVGSVTGIDVWRREVREWCEENVHREGVTELITLRDQERTHGLHYRLPCPDSQFDVIFVPFMASHSFCNQRGDTDDLRRQKVQMMITEYYRVLKPGGRLLTQNITWKINELMDSFKNGSPFTDVITPSKWYWLSAFPSRLTIASKFDRADTTPTVIAVAESDLPSRTVSAVAVTPVPSRPSSASTPSRPPGGSGRASVIVASPGAAPRVNSWLPTPTLSSVEASRLSSPVHVISAHWPLRIGMATLFALIYIFMSWATAHYWEELEIPLKMPWHNMISAMMASNLSLFPLVTYFTWQQVQMYCRLPTLSSKDVLNLLRSVLVEFVSVFCVWNILFWLPSLCLDLALYGHVGSDELGYLNMALNFVVFYCLARGARRLVFWLQRRGRIAISSASKKGNRVLSSARAISQPRTTIRPLDGTPNQGNDDDPTEEDDDEAGPFTGGLHGGGAASGGLSLAYDGTPSVAAHRTTSSIRAISSSAAAVNGQSTSHDLHPHSLNGDAIIASSSKDGNDNLNLIGIRMAPTISSTSSSSYGRENPTTGELKQPLLS